jgi:hypothetical protein
MHVIITRAWIRFIYQMNCDERGAMRRQRYQDLALRGRCYWRRAQKTNSPMGDKGFVFMASAIYADKNALAECPRNHPYYVLSLIPSGIEVSLKRCPYPY